MLRFRKTVLPVMLCLVLLGSSAAAEQPEQSSTNMETSDRMTAAETVDNTFSEDHEELLLNLPSRFHRLTYTDKESGFYVHYTLFLPEKYDPEGSYPLVVFVNDASATGVDLMAPLTRGIGGIVWAADAWQNVYPTIVAVPLYRERILDEQTGYVSQYLDVTKRFIDSLCDEYAVDTDRIYGTGQGVGSTVMMLLASDNPELFSGCMFVGGHWDAEKVSGLEEQRFIYFSSESDRTSLKMEENLLEKFGVDGTRYTHSVWNGSWTADERTTAALKLTTSDSGHYFVRWLKNSIETTGDDLKRASHDEADALKVATYNKAYDCVELMKWLFQQTKENAETAN